MAKSTRDPARKKPFQLVNSPSSAAPRTRYTKNFDLKAAPNAAAAGTPGYYRVIDGTTDDGTHTQIQGSCGVGSGDINFSSTIASGGTVAITSLVYTEGNA